MDFSPVTDFLMIGTTPKTEAYDLLRTLEVGIVINMRWERRPYRDLHTSPIPTLWLPTFDSPVIPIPVRALVRGAHAAQEVIAAGRKVYVHCQMGRHRGVAMGSAVLIAQGYQPEAAMRTIKKARPVADPDAWYIKRQILKFSEVWKRLLHTGAARAPVILQDEGE
jgi:protein-tyrosine phosphatase